MKIVHVNCSDKEPLSLLKTLKGLKGKEVSIPKMSIRWEDDKLWLMK